jgi:GNAT superfamily N-acetyltransferase
MSGSTLQIRNATPEDARAITELHIRAWRAAYRGLFSDERLDALDVTLSAPKREAFLRDMPTPRHRWWVQEEGQELTGFAAVGPSRDEDLGPETIELYAIYVEPTRIDTGLGRHLMEHVLAHARDAGYASLTLWVLVNNTRSNAFYAHAGLVPDARVTPVPAYPGEPLKHRLVLPLPR